QHRGRRRGTAPASEERRRGGRCLRRVPRVVRPEAQGQGARLGHPPLSPRGSGRLLHVGLVHAAEPPEPRPADPPSGGQLPALGTPRPPRAEYPPCPQPTPAPGPTRSA